MCKEYLEARIKIKTKYIKVAYDDYIYRLNKGHIKASEIHKETMERRTRQRQVLIDELNKASK